MRRPPQMARDPSRREFLAAAAAASLSATALPRHAGAAGADPPEAVPPFPMRFPVAPLFPARAFDIRAHGALPGGERSNTRAIAAAIAACAAAGGGRVLVPVGIWLTGAIHLRDRVELHVARDAELRFSADPAEYLPAVYTQRGGVRCHNYSPLIYARGCTGIAVTGAGTLNGQGQAWWPWKERQPGMTRLFEQGASGTPVGQRVFGTVQDGVRPPFIQTIDCRDVLFEGVTLRDGPSWNLHPVTCENVIVRGVSVFARGPNNDGIDPDSCRNVLIEDCLLDTGDDCICLKSGRDRDGWEVGRPCENVVIRRCETRRGHGGVVLGSEMSGGIRNVYVHDCDFDGTDRGIRIKSLPGRGGFIENVWFRRIRMGAIRREAIQVTLRYGDRSVIDPATRAQPALRGFHFHDITCGSAETGIDIAGLPDNPIRDLNLARVRLPARRGSRCDWVAGLRLENADLGAAGTRAPQLTNCAETTIRNER